MGKGGQYQRLLLVVVILGWRARRVPAARRARARRDPRANPALLLFAFAPVALVLAVFPGRGHDFFRAWLGSSPGYLVRKVVYSLILAVDARRLPGAG